jgi:hypothetical protein
MPRATAPRLWHRRHRGAPTTAPASRLRQAFLLQLRRRFIIRRQKDLEGRAVFDLGVKLSRATEGKLRLVSRELLEFGDDGFHRRREVGGDGHLHFVGAGQRRQKQHGKGDGRLGSHGAKHVG